MILEDVTPLYECGFFSKGSSNIINEAFDLSLKEMRPQMVSLVELVDDSSFNKSTAGNQHGDIYESMWEYI